MASPTEEQRRYLEAKTIVIEYERKHPQGKLNSVPRENAKYPYQKVTT